MNHNTLNNENIHHSVLILLVLSVCFTGLFNHDLWTPDEPKVAAISLESEIPGLSGCYRRLWPQVRWQAVTFLLARRLGGMTIALPAAIILATMPGFIDNFHRIRVDPSLAFFVAAAIWCFAEVYVANQRWYCLPAGLFTAGAFLVKGFIGPVLIGMGWLGLAISWLIKRIRGEGKPQFYAEVQGFGALLFIILTGSWIALLRFKGGADLWNMWFWENQVARLLGTSQEFSHLRPGKPY